jgi:hypothetical protein
VKHPAAYLQAIALVAIEAEVEVRHLVRSWCSY